RTAESALSTEPLPEQPRPPATATLRSIQGRVAPPEIPPRSHSRTQEVGQYHGARAPSSPRRGAVATHARKACPPCAARDRMRRTRPYAVAGAICPSLRGKARYAALPTHPHWRARAKLDR